MLVRDDGSIVGTIGGGCVEAEVWQAAREVMEKKPRTLTFDLNKIPSTIPDWSAAARWKSSSSPCCRSRTLYIFGAGHVAWSLYKVARMAGFDVVVTDDREAYANRERFPDARDSLSPTILNA